jgi:hypothetical protein
MVERQEVIFGFFTSVRVFFTQYNEGKNVSRSRVFITVLDTL